MALFGRDVEKPTASGRLPATKAWLRVDRSTVLQSRCRNAIIRLVLGQAQWAIVG
jgi:hypothetical protein